MRADPPRVRVEVDLPFTSPLEPSNLYGHLAATAVPGVEEWREGAYRAAVALAGGPAIVRLGLPRQGVVPAVLLLSRADDEPAATARARRALDLNGDPHAMAGVLTQDAALAPLVAAAPGRRVPGTLDAAAMTLRAVLGQQVSTAAARTHAGRLVVELGRPLADPEGGLTHLFPAPEDLLADPARTASALRVPESRRRTVLAVAEALATGAVDLGASQDLLRTALLALPGVGPWTADTVLMRTRGADVLLAGDLGVIAAAARLGLPTRPRDLVRHAEAWRPFRSSAVQYLWATGAHAVNALPG